MNVPKPGVFYSVGYTDPRVIFDELRIIKRPYGGRYEPKGLLKGLLMKKKVDAHNYKTEAKTLPLEACKSFWIIKYGDRALTGLEAKELMEQDDFTWEIGNRLFWAGEIEHNKEQDLYICKS